VSRQESADITIAADPTTVFDVLCDPTQHSLFDGSESVRGRVSGPPRLYLGASFAMRMRIGLPYVVKNRVVEYDEDRRIAWRHFGRHIWRYELAAVSPTSTRVVETFDYASAPAAKAYELAGIPSRNRRAMEATLQRLKVLVESRTTTVAS
jgi:hypothetical protein